MARKEIICAFGTDIDSVAGWIGSYGGGDSPSDIQRGIFATEVGVPRLLRLFKKYNGKQGVDVKSAPSSLDIAASRAEGKVRGRSTSRAASCCRASACVR